MIRVIVADDHALIRECICALLKSHADLEIIAEADNGVDAVRLAGELVPDVVVMDIGMKDLNGIEATRRIVSGSEQIKVLIFSMHADKRYVIEGLNAGANGFFLKSCATGEIATAIRAVAENGFYLSPELEGMVETDPLRRTSTELPVTILTRREREIVVMLAEGQSSKGIASRLDISAKTVETHRMHIMKKLNFNNVAHLTKYAVREGLLLLN